MRATFRQSMSWLHTWGGLWFTWLLYAIFLTGTLGVFDEAISHWMRDEGRSAVADVPAPDAADRTRALAAAQGFLERAAPQAEFWSIGLPGDEPALRVFWRETDDSPFESRRLDAASGEVLPPGMERETEGGHHFVHMHFELHAGDAGIWIVGVAAMAMLVAMVSGIVVHKKIFADFFTFRPGRGPRSWLDAHNALGVLTLPFQFMIAYTGLVVFWSMYMPAGIQVRYGGDTDAFFAALDESPPPRPVLGIAAMVTPLPALLARAEDTLGRAASFVVVNHPGDASASVRVFGRFDPGGVDPNKLLGGGSGRMSFDGVDGALLDVQMPETRRGGPALATQQTMNALHFVQFGGYPMKWLYFVCGMAGTAMMASGAILFMVKRRRRAADEFGAATARAYRAIEALNVAGIAGLALACIAYLWINRLLPLAIEDRAQWEIRLFFAVWGATLLHAAVRAPLRAWVEQLAVVAALCVALPLLNLLATGDHLAAALARGDGESAGVELATLAIGLPFAAAARRVHRHRHGGAVRGAAARPAAVSVTEAETV